MTVEIQKKTLKKFIHLNPAAIKTALFFKAVSDKNSFVNMTQIEIANELDFTKKTVIVSIQNLVKNGLIIVHKRVPKKNIYEVVF